MNADRKSLTYDEAVAMLPDGDTIHTFRNPAWGLLLGADWSREYILNAIEKHGCELTGGMAAGMNHGIWINDQKDGGGLFIETKKGPSHEP
jgi:hypothetical protein